MKNIIIDELIQLMSDLRDDNGGCQWCKDQTPDTLIPHTLEEAYEVADAVETGSDEELKLELADLLFQIVFHAQIASEKSTFDFYDIAQTLADKIKRRNPHVFQAHKKLSIDEIAHNWEEIKKAESDKRSSVFDGITKSLPALPMAQKLQQRAAHAGFQWPSLENILQKLNEESSELVAAVNNQDPMNMEEEMGDLFLTLVNLTVKLKIDPELALRKSNLKFKHRVQYIEKMLSDKNTDMSSSDFDEMLTLWQQAKAHLKKD